MTSIASFTSALPADSIHAATRAMCCASARVRNLHGDMLTLDPDAPATLLTIDYLASTVKQKQDLFERTAAAAVDMETYPIAAALHARSIPVTALRAISDAANSSLPCAALQWVDPHGQASVMRTATWLLRHPGECIALWRLGKRAKQCSQALAIEVENMLREART